MNKTYKSLLKKASSVMFVLLSMGFMTFLFSSCAESEDETQVNFWEDPDNYRFESDLFLYQYLGDCTHDLSYEEPVIPNGKYYSRQGKDDISIDVPYYIEVTENKYMELKPIDEGVSLEDLSNETNVPYTEKTEFKVITEHKHDDVFISTEWADFPHRTEEAYIGEKYISYEMFYALDYNDSGEMFFSNGSAHFYLEA